MIRLYSTHCPKCKIVEMKMNQKGLAFIVIDNEEEVVNTGKAHNIMSAPILEVDDEFYDFANAVKWINERK